MKRIFAFSMYNVISCILPYKRDGLIMIIYIYGLRIYIGNEEKGDSMQTLYDVIFDMDIYDEFGWELENIKTIKLNGLEISRKFLNFVLHQGDLVEIVTLEEKVYTELLK
ncbi:hypothetical protein D3C76_770440 [compost metagenome]